MSDIATRIATVGFRARAISLLEAIALTTLFAVLTACGAQLALRVPFTPVPVTAQVFFVLLSGAMLGSRLGALSQLQYIGLGLAGFPVFAGGTTANVVLAGPTAGYVVGFVAAAWVVGRGVEVVRQPRYLRLLFAGLAGIAVLYVPGTLWLATWLHATGANTWAEALKAAMVAGILPFWGADVIKAAGVAWVRYRWRQ